MGIEDQDKFLLNYRSDVYSEAAYVYEQLKSVAVANDYVIDLYLKDVIQKLYEFMRKEE